MVTALVQITVRRDVINEVADQIAALDGISEVYSVGGKIDLIAIIRARDNEHLAALVTGHLLKIDGILTSETMIAFKVHSRHDLERMFSIGIEE